MSSFDDLALRLEEKVYSTPKGRIRLSLLKKDLQDFIPGYSRGGLRIDDIGGGSGHFAEDAVRTGHRVRLFDASKKMTDLAVLRRETLPPDQTGHFQICRFDYLASPLPLDNFPADLTCLHGSAEWMADSEAAVQKAVDEAAPGSYLSLLVFNRDRQVLKQGINGQLLPETRPDRRRKLTPPGGLTPHRIREILEPDGTVLLQSGIRIFHDFFRQFDPGTLSDDQWLAQELLWYREEPFTGLGEHSHFIWRKREENRSDH